MNEDRWTGNERECSTCGHLIRDRHSGTLSRFGSECERCLSGVEVRVPEAVIESCAEASPHPPLHRTPEQLAATQTLWDAFDRQQEAEREPFDPRLGAADYAGRLPKLPNAVPCDAETERESDMPIIAKETGGNFKPAPAGAFAAVCCDVVDLGMKETEYAGTKSLKHKIRVVWQVADVDPAIGKRPLVSQRYTLSLHEKAALRKDLQSWRGRTFTPSELQGFDVEKVVGASCLLNIVHSADGQYANVSAIMPLPKGMTAPTIEGYVRDKDRPKAQPEPPENEDHELHEPDGFQVTDNDAPF